MENVFLKLLNMSIAAGWLVLAVVLLRLILKKAPRAILCVLWGIVGIRLILPFSLQSVFSLIPSVETVPEDIGYAANPTISSGVSVVNSVVNPLLSGSLSPDPTQLTSVNPMQIVLLVAAWVWVIGMVGMLVYSLISYLRIFRKVREAVPMRENVWVCDHIDTPFILGIFRPRIYLPSSMSETDAEYVIAHEKAHLSGRDHWWKPIGFLLLTVYWFNPLLWVSYVLLCRDIEVACDQKVIRDMGTDIKKPYSEALINCSVPRKMISACPLAFGEVGVKSRIQSVLSYKKPAFWLILVAVLACVVLSICFLTDPPAKTVRATEIKDSYGVTLLSDDAQTVRFIYGQYAYEAPYSDEIVAELGDILLGKEPIDTITTEPLFAPFYAIYVDGGNLLCFNHDMSECWINGNVRPYDVYPVSDTDYVSRLFAKYVPVLSASDFDSSEQMSGVVEGDVRYFYATVVGINQDGHGSIAVLPAEGTMEAGYSTDGKPILLFTALSSVQLPELKIGDAICATYLGIMADQTPTTLCCGIITKLKQNTGITASAYNVIYGTAMHDIDGDGIIEQCSLSVGLSSGVSSFVMTASDGVSQKYRNQFISNDYASLSFVTISDKLYVQCVPRIYGKVDDGQPTQFDLYEVSVTDGNILLRRTAWEISSTTEGNDTYRTILATQYGESLGYWGQQGVKN